MVRQRGAIAHIVGGTDIMINTVHRQAIDRVADRGLREGILALQLHAGKPMWAEFKNIRMKDMDETH